MMPTAAEPPVDDGEEIDETEFWRSQPGTLAAVTTARAEIRRGDFVTSVDLVAEARAAVAADRASAEWRSVLGAEFPWVDLLPTADRAVFVADVVRAFRLAAQSAAAESLAQVIREWQATAAVYADPELLTVLSDRHDGDDEAVPSVGAPG